MKRSVIILIFFILSGCATKQDTYPDLDISIQNMKATVDYLTDIIPPRNSGNPASMDRAAAYISQKLAEYGASPEEQEFHVDGKRYVNIITSFGPKEKSRVIIGAHYDVCGDQPGADDNASGVAGLLEIARFAKKYESELKYRIDLVAYALEEPPYFGTEEMGSYIHASSLKKANVKVKGMVSLEAIGFFTEEKDSQSYPFGLLKLFYPDTGNFIGIIGDWGSSGLNRQIAKHMRKTLVKVETLKAPAFLTGVDFSDHRNYWGFGYDAVMVTDTAFYRNRNYHEVSDTGDKLSFTKMKEVVKGICWAILNLE